MKSRASLLPVLLSCAALALLDAACGGSEGAPGTAGTGGGTVDGAVDGGIFGDASAGSGGATAGSGGSVGSGGRGVSGTGGAATGGTTGAGGAGGAAVGCFITLTTLSALESGPNMRARMKASVSNGLRVTAWTWQVQFENGNQIPTTPFNDDPSVVDFAIKSPGRYAVKVQAGTGIECRAADVVVTVMAPGMSSFRFRVTPPATAGLDIPTQEQDIEVGPDVSATVRLDLSAGTNVQMAAYDTTGRYIPAYVRISGLSSGVTIEGHTARHPLDVVMLPLAAYDVLVVPDGPYAPNLFSATSAQPGRIQIEQGTYVSGKVVNAAGDPVSGARVILRSGIRPSTVGLSDQLGEFSLWTRAGTLSAVIAPPPGAGLPEANVAAGPAGITIDGYAANRLTMTWAAANRGTLSVLVKTTDGSSPVAGARVRVESDTTQASVVGTLRVENASPSGATQTATLDATGVVRTELNVDATGLTRFPGLPVGSYKVTAVPPGTIPEAALTTTHVGLTAAGFTATVPLASRVMLSGTLLAKGGANGVRVMAIDQSTGITAPVALAIAGDRGAYSLSVDPGSQMVDRVYRLVADPPVGGTLARTVLGVVPIRVGNKVAPDFTVATAVPVTGFVVSDGQAIGGAVVQVFCVSATCLDPTSPIAETVTLQNGSFTVALPASTQSP